MGIGVRVNAVAPGTAYTSMRSRLRLQVAVLLLGPENSFVSGSVYSTDGAWL